MPTAFVSSTFSDLQEHRRRVSTLLRRFGIEDVAMEYYVADSKRPLDRCLADVVACDLYIGLVAWRYGWVPEDNNPERLSITNLEYQAAVRAGKPRLVFLLDPKASWTPDLIDDDRQSIRAFREHLSNGQMVALFGTLPETIDGVLAPALLRQQTTSQIPDIPSIDVASYRAFVQNRYGFVDLDALTDPRRDEMLRLRLQSIFVEQYVRPDAPPFELPKDLYEKLSDESEIDIADFPALALPVDVFRALQVAYRAKTPRPILASLVGEESRCAVVLGDPGAGKSTFARFLLVSLLEQGTQLSLSFPDHLPVLIDLRTYAGLRAERRAETIFEYFDYLAKAELHPISGVEFRRYLEGDRPAVVIFDGLDEIFDSDDQLRVMREIAGFAERYGGARVIVTSRIIGYRRRLLTNAGFRHYTLQDLQKSQVKAFVRQWYALTLSDRPDDVPRRVNRIMSSYKKSRSIRQLAGNPMLLTIMAIIAKHQPLPRERWRLYDHAAGVLIQHWDVNRGIRSVAVDAAVVSEDDKREVLRRLALLMQGVEQGLSGNYIHGATLQMEFETYLRARYMLPGDRAAVIAREMIRQFRERNFILSFYGAGVYGFVHRAFLEYFCASALVFQFEKTGELDLKQLCGVFAEHAFDEDWQEVLRLTAGMLGERYAAAAIDAIIDVARSPGLSPEQISGAIAIAAECLAELRLLDVVADTAKRLVAEACKWVFHLAGTSDLIMLRRVTNAFRTTLAPWPGREQLGGWLASFGDGSFGHNEGRQVARIVGEFVGMLGGGVEEIRHQATQLLERRNVNLRTMAIYALATGWPSRDTLTLLSAACDTYARGTTGDLLGLIDIIGATVEYFSEDPMTSELVQTYGKHSSGVLRLATTFALAPLTAYKLARTMLTILSEDHDGEVRQRASAAVADTPLLSRLDRGVPF